MERIKPYSSSGYIPYLIENICDICGNYFTVKDKRTRNCRNCNHIEHYNKKYELDKYYNMYLEGMNVKQIEKQERFKTNKLRDLFFKFKYPMYGRRKLLIPYIAGIGEDDIKKKEIKNKVDNMFKKVRKELSTGRKKHRKKTGKIIIN